MHERSKEQEEVRGSSDREFGLVFAGFFAILTGIGWWNDSSNTVTFAVIAALFLAVALIFPRVLAPLNRLWTRFGLLLYRVVNPIVMATIFYVIITPIGVAMRLAGKDLLRLKIDGDAASYWIPRDPPGPPPEGMKNQF